MLIINSESLKLINSMSSELNPQAEKLNKLNQGMIKESSSLINRLKD